MKLLPPKPGTCFICAIDHVPEMPHDAGSLYYQYRFYGEHGRWPTWADAVAHCAQQIREFWTSELRSRDLWTEPKTGEPIAETTGVIVSAKPCIGCGTSVQSSDELCDRCRDVANEYVDG